MKKEDLKNGMVVELEDGDRYIVIGDMLTKAGGCLYLHYYDDELRFVSPRREEKLDIVKIFSAVCDLNDIKGRDLTLLWEKPWKPQYNQYYFMPLIDPCECDGYTLGELYTSCIWDNTKIDEKLWNMGLVFPTPEDAEDCAEEMLKVARRIKR